MKFLFVLLASVSLSSAATLWTYNQGLHTTVIETGTGYLFRYNYMPDKQFQFPNLAYVSNYKVEYLKETFEYGESKFPPIQGIVEFDGKTFSTWVPNIPEPSFIYLCGIWLGGIALGRTRV